MALSPPAKVLLNIGYVFLHIQATERTVKIGMQVVLPREEDLLLSLFDKLNEQDRKKPLGHFLAALRKRATLNPDVDSLLERFLDRRNTFVHNLSELSGWTLKTPEGCNNAMSFLSLLLEDSKEVRLLFLGLLHSWKVQSGMDTTDEDDAIFDKLSKYEKPIISRKWNAKNA